MNRSRVSILGVMGIILVAGLGLALVRAERSLMPSALDVCTNIARYASVTILAIATYRARYRRGRAADWWFGFALGGWSYYLLYADFPLSVTSLVRILPHRI